MPPAQNTIHLEINSPIARLTLARPAQHNALSMVELSALQEALLAIEGDKSLRAVILTGQGRSFCAGASLGDVADQDYTDNPFTALCDRLEGLALPVICALNGGVYGGGVDLALACDFRIGVPEMKMFFPPARLGIHYEASGLSRTISRLGLQTAKRLLLRAEIYQGDELLKIGFLDEIVPATDLMGRAERMASDIVALAPLAVQGMKQTLNELAAGNADRDTVRARILTCWSSDDLKEGLAASKEKRPPNFKGK